MASVPYLIYFVNFKDLTPLNYLLKQLTKSLLERALEAEMTDHLGYEKHSPDGHHSGNSRNGHSKKKLITDSGKLPLNVPRDRKGKFEPQIIAKRQSRLDGFDDKIISLYARGMTTREIQGHLEEIYGIDVSPTLISNRLFTQMYAAIWAMVDQPSHDRG
jgi:transposase-like protein